ncbi:hypothetical protein [Natronorubrum halophilum]|uniref:hypothetical protein n=1 Tax=Natronorubrum halophilum TaxID=1702106 RepID=UPI001EE8BBA3|nr:hypothetical protein [Natronorubrum halophilum]
MVLPMQQDTSGSTSRRTFIKYGLATTGVLVGPSSAGAASGDARGNADSSRPLEQGLMRSYQHIPNSQITVDDAITWQPTGLEGPYQTYVISYDHAPSYQALLFADDGRDGATPGPEGNGNGGPETEARTGALRSGDTISLGSVWGSPSETNHRYVTVGLEDGRGGDGSPPEE